MSALAEAWRYRTGEVESRSAYINRSVFEATPILVEDALIFCTPLNAVVALDPGTGEERWRFDPIPREAGDPALTTWPEGEAPVEGHANVWSIMSVDEARDLVFLPTSSPSPDFYGGLRAGDNLYANSVVALRGRTGERVWHFQTVRHDVWDYDVPAQPGLYTLTQDGETRDVVVQVSKTGFVFVLDRETGEPVLPVEDRPVPQGGVPGEVLSPTQPFPVATPPLVPNTLTPDDAFGVTLWDRLACRAQIRNARFDGLFTPPSVEGTLLYPFTGGGRFDERCHCLAQDFRDHGGSGPRHAGLTAGHAQSGGAGGDGG